MTLKVLATLAGFTLASLANSHFIFLELDPERPESVAMRFAEEPLEATPKALQDKAAPMAVVTASGEAIALHSEEAALEGPVSVDASVVFGSLAYGVLDRSESGRGRFLLVYHAKGTRGVAPAGEPCGLAVDVVATLEGDTLQVTVLHQGEPVPDAELDCVLPQELDHVTGKTGSDGTAEFPLPQGGWVGIRAMVALEESGEHEGESYGLVRHYSTLTFKHTVE